MGYELLNKNKVLATFDITGQDALEMVQNVKILSNLPLWITDITDWITNRSAAKHRHFVQKLLNSLHANTLSGFINATNCLSIQDTLWIRKAESELTWSQVNLFENEFSEVLTRLAFDGTGLGDVEISTTTPELTTDGAYDKCWIRKNNNIMLLKAGSSGSPQAGLEPYSEVLASQFFVNFCAAVPYQIEQYYNRTVSSCKSFVYQNVGYKPVSVWLPRKTTLAKLLNFIEEQQCDSNEFRRMLIADSVCVNCDRHFGNFGFLIDNQTYQIQKLAPAFDFNMAFTPYATEETHFLQYDQYLESWHPFLHTSHVELAKLLLTPEVKADLINLKDLILILPEWCFQIKEYPFTRKRLEYINEIKNVQIDRILGRSRQFSFAAPAEEKATESYEK